MRTNLHRHNTRIHNAHICRTIESQPSIDHTTQIFTHHRTRRNRVMNGVKGVPDPTLPIRAGPTIVAWVRNGAEARLGFASGESGEWCGFEEFADEFGTGYLDVEIEVDTEIVDVDLGLGECVRGGDLYCATAEG